MINKTEMLLKKQFLKMLPNIEEPYVGKSVIGSFSKNENPVEIG